jgi:hypothetical protein
MPGEVATGAAAMSTSTLTGIPISTTISIAANTRGATVARADVDKGPGDFSTIRSTVKVFPIAIKVQRKNSIVRVPMTQSNRASSSAAGPTPADKI